MVIPCAPGQEALDVPAPLTWQGRLGPGADKGSRRGGMTGLLDGLMGEPGADTQREVSAQGFFLLGIGLIEEGIHGHSVSIFFEYDN